MAMQQQDKDQLISRLKAGHIRFSDVLQFIETHYNYTPGSFKNGEQHNAATENQGSAKVLCFAQVNKLSKDDTLALFAEHYDEVLNTPEAGNHQNIRQFIKYGWEGVRFNDPVLAEK